MQAFPKRSIAELKALHHRTPARRRSTTTSDRSPGYLAPITRIGGGEVRVDRALASTAAAWNKSNHRGVLSFALRDVTAKKTTITKTVVVRNYSSKKRTYAISADLPLRGRPGQRGRQDLASRASITVGKRSTASRSRSR